MTQAWATFREAGWMAWVVLVIGAGGAVAGLLALVAAIRRSPAALQLAVAAVVAGALCAAIGGLGVVQKRAETDGAVAGARPVPRERYRREGYRRARSAAVVGLWLAAFPLLAGVVAALASPRRRPEDDELPPGVSPPLRLALPLGVAAAGVFFATLGWEARRAPLPGRAMAVDDPLWDVLDEVELLRAARGRDDIVHGCQRLGPLLDRVGERAAAAVPDLPKLGRGCVAEWLAQGMAKPLAEGLGELEALTKSHFVKVDPLAEQAVQDRLLAIPPQVAPERPKVSVTIGEPVVEGGLSREAIEQGIARQAGMLERCYLASDLSYDSVAGEVVVRFSVDEHGYVTQRFVVSATLADPRLRMCVLVVVSTMGFARKDRRTARVVVPIRFGVTPP